MKIVTAKEEIENLEHRLQAAQDHIESCEKVIESQEKLIEAQKEVIEHDKVYIQHLKESLGKTLEIHQRLEQAFKDEIGSLERVVKAQDNLIERLDGAEGT